MAGELEGEVGFDRGVDLAGAALVDVPAAIGELAAADVGDAFVLEDGVQFARTNACRGCNPSRGSNRPSTRRTSSHPGAGAGAGFAGLAGWPAEWDQRCGGLQWRSCLDGGFRKLSQSAFHRSTCRRGSRRLRSGTSDTDRPLHGYLTAKASVSLGRRRQ